MNNFNYKEIKQVKNRFDALYDVAYKVLKKYNIPFEPTLQGVLKALNEATTLSPKRNYLNVVTDKEGLVQSITPIGKVYPEFPITKEIDDAIKGQWLREHKEVLIIDEELKRMREEVIYD